MLRAYMSRPHDTQSTRLQNPGRRRLLQAGAAGVTAALGSSAVSLGAREQQAQTPPAAPPGPPAATGVIDPAALPAETWCEAWTVAARRTGLASRSSSTSSSATSRRRRRRSARCFPGSSVLAASARRRRFAFEAAARFASASATCLASTSARCGSGRVLIRRRSRRRWRRSFSAGRKGRRQASAEGARSGVQSARVPRRAGSAPRCPVHGRPLHAARLQLGARLAGDEHPHPRTARHARRQSGPRHRVRQRPGAICSAKTTGRCARRWAARRAARSRRTSTSGTSTTSSCSATSRRPTMVRAGRPPQTDPPGTLLVSPARARLDARPGLRRHGGLSHRRRRRRRRDQCWR